jgi:plastocyanin domain-containing protein
METTHNIEIQTANKNILAGFVNRWLYPAQHEEQIDFYAGRILAYRVMSTMGYDPERLYEIEQVSYRTKFANTAAVMDYLTAE